jgi:hypothetical protein
MTAAVTINALFGLAALALVACVFYGPWQEVCTAFARQIIFERRDAIFDLARAGRLDFASDEYRTIRQSLEKSIRFAHEMTWVRCAFLYNALRRRGGAASGKTELQEAIDRINDPATRDEVRRLTSEATAAVVVMMGFKSAILLIGAVCVVIAVCVVGVTNSTVRVLGKMTEELLQAEDDEFVINGTERPGLKAS